MKYPKITGRVVRQNARGAKMGFPTANLDVQNPPEFADGVYFAYTIIDGAKYPSLVFIGVPTTFGDTRSTVESYILDFDGDLYGQTLTIEVLEKLRDNEHFDSEVELIDAMIEDEETAREFFGRLKGEGKKG